MMNVIVEGQSPLEEISSPELRIRGKRKEGSPEHRESLETNGESILVRKLKRHPRPYDDAKFIYEEIKQFRFFQNFVSTLSGSSEEKVLLQICRSVTYEKIEKGKHIFKEGDASNNKFYVILSGKVSIIFRKDTNMFIEENKRKMKRPSLKMALAQRPSLMPNVPENKTEVELRSLSQINHMETDTDLPDLTETTRSRGNTKFSRRHTEIAENVKNLVKVSIVIKQSGIKNDSSNKIVDPSESLGFKRNELSVGEAFGEKAIMVPDPSMAKRTASAYAETECEFLIIHRNDFLYIKGKFDKEKEFKNSFLYKNIPALLRVASSSTVENLLYSFKELHLGKSNMLTKEGAEGQEVFYLVEGNCSIRRSFINEKNELLGKKKEIVISLIGENELIGAEILMDEKDPPRYKYSVQVTTNRAKFYTITSNYLKTKFPAETLSHLIAIHNKKEGMRDPIFNKYVAKAEEQDKVENKNTKKLYDVIKNKELLGFMTENLKKNVITTKNDEKNRISTEESLDIHVANKLNEYKKEILDRFMKKKLVMERIRNKMSTKNTDVNFLFKYFEEKRKKESNEKKGNPWQEMDSQKGVNEFDELIKLIDVSIRDLNLEELEQEGVDRYLRFSTLKFHELGQSPLRRVSSQSKTTTNQEQFENLKIFDFGKDEGVDKLRIKERQQVLPKVVFHRTDRSVNLSEKFKKRKNIYNIRSENSRHELSISSFYQPSGAGLRTISSGLQILDTLGVHDSNDFYGKGSNNVSRLSSVEVKASDRLKPLSHNIQKDNEIREFFLEGEANLKSSSKKQSSEGNRSQTASRASLREPFNLSNFLKHRHKRNTSLSSLSKVRKDVLQNENNFL